MAPTMTMKFEENKRLVSGGLLKSARVGRNISIDANHLNLAYLKRPIKKPEFNEKKLPKPVVRDGHADLIYLHVITAAEAFVEANQHLI
jgi:hypothetical protein